MPFMSSLNSFIAFMPDAITRSVRGVLPARERPAHGVKQPIAVGWQLIPPPGDMLIGSDQHELSLVETARFGVVQFIDLEGHGEAFRRLLDRRGVDRGIQLEQAKVRTE